MAFLPGWGRRKEIRYGTVFPGANLSDFPKLLVIDGDSDIAAELSGGGGITVTLDDGTTEMPFGLYPSSDPTSGDLILRVKFDLLTAASTGDVIGYLYYDAGQSTVEDKAGVVSNGYVLFMPLEEDPSGSAPQMFDWVSESNVGTCNGSMTSGDLVPAEVANGLDFDGSDGVDISTSGAAMPLTLECWFRPDNVTGNRTLVCWSKPSNANDYYAIQFRGATMGDPVVATSRNTTGPAEATSGSSGISAGTWHHLAGVYSGATARAVYLDGASAGTNTTSITPGGPPDTVSIGYLNRGAGDTDWMLGGVDEVRVSSVARSADWLAYAYEDDFDNADTFTLGDEETDGGGGGGFKAWWAGRGSALGAGVM